MKSCHGLRGPRNKLFDDVEGNARDTKIDPRQVVPPARVLCTRKEFRQKVTRLCGRSHVTEVGQEVTYVGHHSKS